MTRLRGAYHRAGGRVAAPDEQARRNPVVETILQGADRCFRCTATDREIRWVGSVTAPSGCGELYACEECVAGLDRMVRRQNGARDR